MRLKNNQYKKSNNISITDDLWKFFTQTLTEKRIFNLLKKVKEKNRISQDKLFFLSAANVAAYYWCAMKSYFQLKEGEVDFFAAYLEDRIIYSYELGRLKKLPERDEDILKIGDDITYKDIEYLLKNKKEYYFAVPTNNRYKIKEVKKKEDKLFKEKMRKTKGKSKILLNYLYYDETDKNDPLERGTILQFEKAEKYPTIRWNFLWDRYIVIACPDGITDTFVYEFKTSQHSRGYVMSYVKPVAFAQGDIYGLFFERLEKRIQLYSEGDNELLTFQEPVNISNAISILEGVKNIENGILPFHPKEWKCKRCEYRSKCSLK